MTSDMKKEVICVLCEFVLKGPIEFPCGCLFCKEHLSDHFVTKDKILCRKCNKEFNISRGTFPTANKKVTDIINKEGYLNENDKAFKKEVNAMVDEWRQQLDVLIEEKRLFAEKNYDHFSDVQNKIDLHRERFKLAVCAKIDEYALAMIDKTKEAEKAFNARLNELAIHSVDFDKVREDINKEFRKVNLTIENIQQLKTKQQDQVEQEKAKLNKVKQLKDQIKACSFQSTENNFASSFFGKLNLSSLKPKSKIVSCSSDETINVWDLKTKECIKTLSGHTREISCIEAVNDTQVLSGSADRSIKLWDLNEGVCLRTFLGHSLAVVSVKMLTENTFASGSYKQIKIWHLNDGRCLKLINGHDDYIKTLALLPDGNFISGSYDENIKV